MNCFRITCACALTLIACASRAQEYPAPEVVHPNQRIEVPIAPSMGTPEKPAPQAALDVVLQAENIHCATGSAVDTATERMSGSTLKELAEKLSGASCNTDAGPQRLQGDFTPNGGIQAENLIAALAARHPLLLRYRSVTYVLYGVVYDEHLRSDGSRRNVIRELLLLDPSRSGRTTIFRRDKDDFGQVEGVASIGLSR